MGMGGEGPVEQDFPACGHASSRRAVLGGGSHLTFQVTPSFGPREAPRYGLRAKLSLIYDLSLDLH